MEVNVVLLEFLDELRVLTPWSGVFRLLLATLFGGMLGVERGRKGRAAGFRTYMIVCIGATLTMMLGQYESLMVNGAWSTTLGAAGTKIDVSRFGAQVINGIGFLGAGTIIVTGHQKVKGVTTAAGLWASACMGIAVGAGFYECVFLGFLLILICFRVLPLIESYISDYSSEINVYIEFDRMDRLDDIFTGIKALHISIHDVEIDHGHEGVRRLPSAVFYLNLPGKRAHADVLTELAKIPGVRLIDEV